MAVPPIQTFSTCSTHHKSCNGTWTESWGHTQMTLMGLKMKPLTPLTANPPPPTVLHGPATFENGPDGVLLSFLRQQERAVSEEATHTLSRSMSCLCRSSPSVLRKSLKCWIWSASSGFRVNSAGNSEIQYLEAGMKQREHVRCVVAV